MSSNDLPQEWSDYSKENLLEDMELLREQGLIEVVGINSDGDWLYALTESTRKMIDENKSDDPWAVISQLLIDELPNRDDIS